MLVAGMLSAFGMLNFRMLNFRMFSYAEFSYAEIFRFFCELFRLHLIFSFFAFFHEQFLLFLTFFADFLFFPYVGHGTLP